MTLDLTAQRGTPLDQQRFTWREIAGALPISKLDDDAFTRVRVILMNGIMSDALRFKHIASRLNGPLRRPLAEVRRVEQHMQTMINWLLPADQSPLETTIGYEQVAIEVTAAIAQHEPDPYLAQVYRFGLLEDFDHLYRYSALLDRLEGKDANNILQSYTDVRPGRPTAVEHRAPVDDLRRHYDRKIAAPITKLHAITLFAGEYQTHDYYMHVGPLFSDPVARMLYAEIASIEEQHVTQYECLADPTESWLEKWLLHEATEVYNFWGCMRQESNPRLKAVWERFLDYELGQLSMVKDLFERIENRDPFSVIPKKLPEPIDFSSQRTFVRQVLKDEVDFRAVGTEIVPLEKETPRSPSVLYRDHMNSEGSPTQIVAANYEWRPGGELMDQAAVQATVH
ncbi:MAG: hypothetical protein JWN44_6843 [Myxococcales bacterium]|nr:hypothetical protein [Myxococcales bacterium]